MKTICVFCSSKNPSNPKYAEATIQLAKILSDNNYTIIYGGTQKGLMALLSAEVRKNKGKIIGILPEVFSNLHSPEEEIIRTKNFAERKEEMITKSDAFVCLPGAYGTLDEMTDVIVGKLIRAHNKPIVLINTDGFYNNLLAHFKKIIDEKLTDNYESLYGIINTPKEAIEYLKNYVPVEVKDPAIHG